MKCDNTGRMVKGLRVTTYRPYVNWAAKDTTIHSLTAEVAAEINANVSELEGLYKDVYPNQWDGGELMKNVRNWLHTTGKHLLFVYGAQDPWTGAAIPDITDNVNVHKVLAPGVGHSNDFMTGFDKNTSLTIQSIISSYIKH